MRKYVEQSSLDWHLWRAEGIGSSEVPAVMGKSPYQKPFDLFEVKTKRRTREFNENPAMRRGRELEDVARKKFAAWYSITNNTEEPFAPACFQSDELPFMRSSVDGISADGRHLIEIKYQGAANHAAARSGVVRLHHKIQIQHQLLVTGASLATYVSIGDDGSVIPAPVAVDLEMRQSIITECSKFWGYVQANKWPSESNDVGHLFEQFEQIAAEIKELEGQRDQLKEKIVNTGVRECGPWRVTEVERMGSVDWAALQKKYASTFSSAGIKPDEFRKPASKYAQIKRSD